MKTLFSLLVILFMLSCDRIDNINHYLPKPVTQEELIANGFYKYSYSDTIKSENNGIVKYIVKYDMYSNVKESTKDNGEVFPTQLWNFNDPDSIKKKINSEYLKKELSNRIITYLFRDDSLFYKDIIVFSIDKLQNRIADLSTKEKIIKYYQNIKISIKPIPKNDNKIEKYPRQFLIDNYVATINYFSDSEEFYEFFINYKNNDTYKHILEDWYSGRMSNTRYYL